MQPPGHRDRPVFALGGFRVRHRNESAVEVHVLPKLREQFAPPHPGVERGITIGRRCAAQAARSLLPRRPTSPGGAAPRSRTMRMRAMGFAGMKPSSSRPVKSRWRMTSMSRLTVVSESGFASSLLRFRDVPRGDTCGNRAMSFFVIVPMGVSEKSSKTASRAGDATALHLPRRGTVA